MAVGHEVTKEILNMKAASAVIGLRDALEEVEKVYKYLARLDQIEIDALAYQPGEFQIISSAFNDLIALKRVAHGEQAQPSAVDFFAWGAKLTGLE